MQYNTAQILYRKALVLISRSTFKFNALKMGFPEGNHTKLVKVNFYLI